MEVRDLSPSPVGLSSAQEDRVWVERARYGDEDAFGFGKHVLCFNTAKHLSVQKDCETGWAEGSIVLGEVDDGLGLTFSTEHSSFLLSSRNHGSNFNGVRWP